MTSTIATIYERDDAASGSTRIQLVVIEGDAAGRAVSLSGSAVIVGSDSSCDLVLADERVSRQHARLWRSERGVHICDLDSQNGTLYQGSAIGEAVIPIGATLKMGRTFLRVKPQPEPLDIEPSSRREFGELVGESLASRELFAVLDMAASSDVTVLLEGETGTGKELAARAIHDYSDRRKAPFVVVDCAALPESLVESELFGHKRGAFTGAAEDRLGAFQRADGGTLFLDELDSLPPQVQPKLLRALEARTVQPLGDDQVRSVDVRFVAGTRRDLETLVAEGQFRADLFFRIAVLHVHVVPLRQRREDIGPIVSALLRRAGWHEPQVQGPSLNRLMAHDYPGNVRELRNIIDRALALSPQARSFDQLRFQLRAGASEGLVVHTELSFSQAKERVVAAFERQYLRAALERAKGNVSQAARDIDLDRKHLRRLIDKHGLG